MVKKQLLPSDQMSMDEYVKEDLSRMLNLVEDYEKNRPNGKVLLNYAERLDELIDEIIRDPRNYYHTPKFITIGDASDGIISTKIENKYFYEHLMPKIDTVDFRNKLERMMEKPVNLNNSTKKELTPAERKGFELFAMAKKLPQVDGYRSIYPDIYFQVHDDIYLGHEKMRELAKQRDAFGENIPAEFEKKYLRELADIVVDAPQIYYELPDSITKNLQVPNHFYERLVERSDVLERYQREVAEARVNGSIIRGDELYKEKLFGFVENYAQEAEKQAEQLLAKMEQGDFQRFETPEASESIMDFTAEEVAFFSGSDGVSQEDIDSYYASLVDTDIVPPVEQSELSNEDYFFDPEDDPAWVKGDVDFTHDDAYFASLEEDANITIDLNNEDDFYPYQNYVFEGKPHEVQLGIDELDTSDTTFIFKNDEKLQGLSDEWYKLNNKEHLSQQDVSRMAAIEEKMGELVADNQSLYISIPSEVAKPTQGNSPFFNSFLEATKKSGVDVDMLIESDLVQYRNSNFKWAAYNKEDDLEVEVDLNDVER